YVPREWIDDRERARRAGIPDDQAFATKPQIALTQLREAIASGIVPGIVLADAGYGDETAFREGISELGLLYAVGIRPGTSVWAPGTAPLAPKPWNGRGNAPTLLRRA
ncbi:transposase, partial [Paraburkholderia sediminicola]